MTLEDQVAVLVVKGRGDCVDMVSGRRYLGRIGARLAILKAVPTEKGKRLAQRATRVLVRGWRLS